MDAKGVKAAFALCATGVQRERGSKPKLGRLNAALAELRDDEKRFNKTWAGRREACATDI
jgi:hypothetical protein